MPKRKSKSSENPTNESSITKKKSTQGRSKHGRKKKSFQCNLKTKEKKEISSNWKELSKSLGVSLQRKTAQPNAGSRRVKEWLGAPENDGSGSNKKKKKPDIWFDDVPMEVINGEYKPPKNESISTSLVTGQNKSVGRQVALDCEMVGTGSEGSYSMLARACVVNHHGNVLYDSFVAPMDRITDYRTLVSGVLPKHLHGAPDFSVVQKKISDLLKDRILVGHSVQNDLKALLLSHPKKDIRDTSKYRVFKTIAKTRYPSLKKLAKEILGIDIQTKEHNPVEDAQVAMKLYRMHREGWEESVRARLTRAEIRQRRREKRKQDTERDKPVLEKPYNVVLHTR